MSESGDDPAQVEVGGAKIMAPLRDAMGFIHHEQRDVETLEQVDECLVFKALGRDIDELQVAALDALEVRRFFVFGERAVQGDGAADARIGEHVELILHEGDQRRNDHRRSRQQQRRKLIAERFSSAGREDGKSILAFEHAGNDFLLPWVEKFVPEVAPQGFVEVDVDGHDGVVDLSWSECVREKIRNAPVSYYRGSWVGRKLSAGFCLPLVFLFETYHFVWLWTSV